MSKKVVGPAKPIYQVTESLQYVTGTVAGVGNNVLVVAPGRHRCIVVTAFVMQNETAVATTLRLRDGLANSRWRLRAPAVGDMLAVALSPGREWRLSVNQPLIMNLSGANQCGYSIQYFIEKC